MSRLVNRLSPLRVGLLVMRPPTWSPFAARLNNKEPLQHRPHRLILRGFAPSGGLRSGGIGERVQVLGFGFVEL